jgi:sulfite reductase (NADPH) hemoprotein beta-component
MESTKGVARVSYITSSRLVDVQSAPGPFPSAFDFSHFAHLEAKPGVVRLSKDSDIAQAISSLDTFLTTLTITHPDATLVSRLLVALPPASLMPLVVNIAIDNSGLSRVLTLRSASPYVLFSGTTWQAHDYALLAARLASTEKKTVLHIFLADGASGEGDVPDIPETSIQAFMAAPVRSGATLNETSTIPNGHANGHVIGHLPKANGHSRTDSLSRDLDDSLESDLYRAYSGAALSTLALVRRAVKSSSYAGSSHAEVIAITLSKCI